MKIVEWLTVLSAVALAACSRHTYRNCPPGIQSSSVNFRFAPDTTRAGTLTGALVSLPDSQALRNALVLIDSGRRRTTTDQTGRFLLTGVAPGLHTAEFRLVGFNAATIQLTMPSNGGLSVTGGLGWVCYVPPMF